MKYRHTNKKHALQGHATAYATKKTGDTHRQHH